MTTWNKIIPQDIISCEPVTECVPAWVSAKLTPIKWGILIPTRNINRKEIPVETFRSTGVSCSLCFMIIPNTNAATGLRYGYFLLLHTALYCRDKVSASQKYDNGIEENSFPILPPVNLFSCFHPMDNSINTITTTIISCQRKPIIMIWRGIIKRMVSRSSKIARTWISYISSWTLIR